MSAPARGSPAGSTGCATTATLVFVDLRDHYGITQCVAESGEPLFDAVTALKPETVVTLTGLVVTRDEETVNPKIPTGEVEVRIAEMEVQNAARDPAAAGPRRARLRRGGAAPLPLSRPPARAHAPEHGAPQRHRRQHPPAHGGSRLHGVPYADPHGQLARGRARLPGAEPAPSRHLLCAAAGPAAVQAARHGVGLRPLLPDRALLPRRGRARRPLPRRVLPARYRDGLRRAGGRVRRAGAGDARRLHRVHRARPSPSRRSRASPTRTRCCASAPTSRTCASPSRSSI